MVQVLRTVGGQFRLVGPLTLANALSNPGFDVGTTDWVTTSSRVSASVATDRKWEGAQSCLVTATSGTSALCGVVQTLTTEVIPGMDFTLSGHIFVPNALPSPLLAYLNYLDSDGASLTVRTFEVHPGTVTMDWALVSYVEHSVPDIAATAQIGLVVSTDQAFSFYMDAMRWTSGDSTDYVDGDFSGYVWASDRFTSHTLKSTPPDALVSFNVGQHIVSPTPVVS